MSETPRRPAPTGPEWVLFAAAVVLLVALVGVLLVDWLAAPAEPPAFELRLAEARRVSDGYHVDVDVTNVGAAAAAEVTISVEYDEGGKLTELDQLVAFLAPDEEPDPGGLSVAVSSFREP